MPLFKSILQKFGVRLDKHDTEIEEIKQQLEATSGRLDEYDDRLTKMEDALETVVAGFEKRFADLAQRSREAKDQRKKDMASIRREIDVFVQIVELSATAQLDAARQERIKKLLKNARTKRTKLDTLLASKVANDAA